MVFGPCTGGCSQVPIRGVFPVPRLDARCTLMRAGRRAATRSDGSSFNRIAKERLRSGERAKMTVRCLAWQLPCNSRATQDSFVHMRARGGAKGD